MFNVSPAVKPRSQPKGTCCWLTCFEMMFEWKQDKGDKSKDPAKICDLIDRSETLWSDYLYSHGIAPYECREASRMLGMMASGDTTVIDAENLMALLQSKGPVWIAGNWGRGSHVIVVTGCDDTGRIVYIDPWENYSLTPSQGTVGWLSKRSTSWTNCDASVMTWQWDA